MRRRERVKTRLGVEGLEGRACPSVVAAMFHGALLVVDDQPNLAITQTGAQTVRVQDGGSFDQTFTGVNNGANIVATAAASTVVVKLQGNTFLNDLNVLFSSTTGALHVENGAITGNVRVAGLRGSDRVDLGDGTAGLAIGQSVVVATGLSASSALDMHNNVTIGGNLSVYNTTTVTLEPSSRVLGAVLVTGPVTGSNTVLDGTINKNVAVIGSIVADRLNVGSAAVIGGGLGVVLSGGNDIANIAGTIRGLYLDTGTGNDTVSLTANVAEQAIATLGDGDDVLNDAASVGGADATHGLFFVDAGAGTDMVTIAASAQISGVGAVQLGANDDTFTLEGRSDVLPLLADGGTGNNTFKGNKAQLKFQPVNFQTFA